METEKVRNDISIFFNFTGVSFEVSDPLMSLVGVVEPLLYYDRLSVENFPTQSELWEEHIDQLVSEMKNKLEGRALSRKDRDGRIRIIVALDLAKGIVAPSGNNSLFFPAQNARYFKEKVKKAFSEKSYDEENRLVDRFTYCFIFIDSSNDRQLVPWLYRETAYHGYTTSGDGFDWISTDMLNAPDLSKASDDISEEMLEEVLAKVEKHLERAGVKDEFRNRFLQGRVSCKTSSKNLVLSTITSLVGLGCDYFRDCTCFLLRVKNSPDEEKCKGEVFFKSLIQLLVTIDDDSYRADFLPEPSMFKPWYFVLDVANGRLSDRIDHESLTKYAGMVERCEMRVDNLVKKKDVMVTYKHFENNAHDPSDVDSHKKQNDKLASLRMDKVLKFREDRKVPFFFGKHVGDWSWYNTVLGDLDDLYQFEVENDRPLYDAPKRLTDSEMKPTFRTCPFSELEERKRALEGNPPEPVKMENYKEYQDKRHAMMEVFAKAIGDLKKEMVKLGFFSRLLWISIISSVAITLCYTYHYFHNGFEEQAIAIAGCFLAIALLFVLASVVARSTIKSRIRNIYSQIDVIVQDLKKALDDFLQTVYKRVRYQNEADIRKRNLDEMQAQVDGFNGHNKQVEIWKKHYVGVGEKLRHIIEYTSRDGDDYDAPDPSVTISLVPGDFKLSRFPFIPYKIRKEFSDMSTVMLTQDGMRVKGITCFVKKFEFTRHPN